MSELQPGCVSTPAESVRSASELERAPAQLELELDPWMLGVVPFCSSCAGDGRHEATCAGLREDLTAFFGAERAAKWLDAYAAREPNKTDDLRGTSDDEESCPSD